MPLVEKTGGAAIYLRALDRTVSVGDRADVSEDYAAYLCEERGDFERVGGVTDVEFTELTEDADGLDADAIEESIDAGECPWCDEYEGDAVGQHASSAHPDAWDDYKEG